MNSKTVTRRNWIGCTAIAATQMGTVAQPGPGSEPLDWTLIQAAAALQTGGISSEELTKLSLLRIRKLNPVLNAFITVDEESALKQAQDCDRRRNAGRALGYLHGLPIALKDNIDTAGVRTTAGSQVFTDRVPAEDAEVTRRLKAAGVVLLGKLNLDQMGIRRHRYNQLLRSRGTIRPAGRIRLITPRVAVLMVLIPKLPAFATEYPDILLDITTSSDRVKNHLGTGIQIGEYIKREMIAVRVSDDLRLAGLFPDTSSPANARDLKNHSCIAFRFSTGVYRWEFEKGRKALTVNPQGTIVHDDSELVVEGALTGPGIGSALETSVAELIKQGRLVQVLKEWCPSFPGFYLYYPGRRNKPEPYQL